MCGIAGYIGKSKKPKLTYELITHLFDYLEFRGTDAAGVWATEVGDGRVFYHKEPIRSSDFIQKEFWHSLKKVKTNLMLIHARATSTGNGHARHNSNNHPFTSMDKRLAMIHNGTLSEFQFLKDKYEIQSNTDSEVLLRMFEEKMEDDSADFPDRIKGIENIWSVIDNGAMAVGIGERIDADMRYLFLFRNHKRPLWIADLRELLGQVFFFSSPDIWYRAVQASNKLQRMVAGVPDLIEVPTKQIWCLWIDADNPMLLNDEQVEKYNLTTKDSGKTWTAGEKVEIKGSLEELEVMSYLDEEDNLMYVEEEVIWEGKDDKQWANKTDTSLSHYDNHGRDLNDYDINSSYTPDNRGFSVIDPPENSTDHEEILLQIGNFATDIETKANNLLMQGTLSAAEYQELLDSLEQTKTDLEGTLRLLGG